MSDNEDKPPLMSAGLQTFLWHRLVEVSGLVICALSLGLLVILLTANPADPSLNTASAREVQNWFGPSGANLANLLYQAVGFCTGLWPGAVYLGHPPDHDQTSGQVEMAAACSGSGGVV